MQKYDKQDKLFLHVGPMIGISLRIDDSCLYGDELNGEDKMRALNSVLAFSLLMAGVSGVASAQTTDAAPAAAPAAESQPAVRLGERIYLASGRRLGTVDRLLSDGSLRVMTEQAFVVVPAATLSYVNGHHVTSSTLKQLSSR